LSFELLIIGIVLLLSIFAVLQKGRYQKLFNGLKRNFAIARQVKKQALNFELAQVKMYDTISFDGWWQILCNMGENMGFQSLTLLNHENGMYKSAFNWNTLGEKTGKHRAVEINLPLEPESGGEFILRAHIYVEDYLELSGHQVKLLTRLIDEFPLPCDRRCAEGVPPSSITMRGQDARDTTINESQVTSHGRSLKSFTDSFRNISSSLHSIFKHH
jgi:hypothetical protein